MGMIKFEYKKVACDGKMILRYGELSLEQLNSLGNEGWELVTIISGECIFKRQIKE
jgi:hypothetical protein